MNSLKLSDVQQYIEENIGPKYHDKRYAKLTGLSLDGMLERKNPYLFRAKNIIFADELVKLLLDALTSSGDETTFGDFLEGLAIHICGIAFGGTKSGIKGIDLEFQRDGVRFFVAIKSGPNWGNSAQVTKLETDFNTARRTLGTSGAKVNSVFVNGCCYGKEPRSAEDKGSYIKLCGQRFWELISSVPSLYLDIIEPLGYKAKERRDDLEEAYAELVNKFTAEFVARYCDGGKILWDKFVKQTSEAMP